ncbi:hypothetical protein TNCV_2512191, partial [Trichonephila clavipes]
LTVTAFCDSRASYPDGRRVASFYFRGGSFFCFKKNCA